MTRPGGFVARTLSELCEEIGARLELLDPLGQVGLITFADGRQARFKGACFDINPAAAYRIARDKDYAAGLLGRAGVRAPEGRLVLSPRHRDKLAAHDPARAARYRPYGDAIAAAEAFGYPVYAKPNEGAEGDGVRLVRDVDGLVAHLAMLFERFDTVLIQPPVPGSDVRVVVLDGTVEMAYRREPLAVIGDGQTALGALLTQHVAALGDVGRRLNMAALRPRVERHLSETGLTLSSVAASDALVPLLSNANLSSGGRAVDVTDAIDPAYAAVAVAAARALGLRFAGVDLLCADIGRCDPDHVVLEVNGAPALNNFSAEGPRQAERVRTFYRRLLAALAAE